MGGAEETLGGAGGIIEGARRHYNEQRRQWEKQGDIRRTKKTQEEQRRH